MTSEARKILAITAFVFAILSWVGPWPIPLAVSVILLALLHLL